jgi:hypothetical protein
LQLYTFCVLEHHSSPKKVDFHDKITPNPLLYCAC